MKINPNKILWPTDLSVLSSKAAGYVRGFRDTFGAELHVVHVCVPLPDPELLPEGVVLSEPDMEILETFLEAQRKKLQSFAEENLGKSSKMVCKVLSGHPCSEICEYAKRESVDLIIIATHGLTGLKHLLIGSTAERVVQHASCPVLTIKSIERDFTVG
jgi:universal stress protein A